MAIITLRIPQVLKRRFETACKKNDITMSQAIRQMIYQFIKGK